MHQLHPHPATRVRPLHGQPEDVVWGAVVEGAGTFEGREEKDGGRAVVVVWAGGEDAPFWEAFCRVG